MLRRLLLLRPLPQADEHANDKNEDSEQRTLDILDTDGLLVLRKLNWFPKTVTDHMLFREINRFPTAVTDQV